MQTTPHKLELREDSNTIQDEKFNIQLEYSDKTDITRD